MTKKKWKKFEELVAKIQSSLAPDAIVTPNDKIRGVNSESLRQIDISIRQQIAQFPILIVMECKDYSTPVDTPEVQSFLATVSDVEANKGVMVSAKGFTKGALNTGRKAGITLYTLVDTENHDWKSDVSLPFLYSDLIPDGYKIILAGSEPTYQPPPLPGNIELYDGSNHFIGIVDYLVKKQWNNTPFPNESNIYEMDLFQEPTKTKFRDQFIDLKVTVKHKATNKLYFGYLPVKEVSGFKDAVTNEISTQKLQTDFFDPVKVANECQEIQSPEEIPVKPIFEVHTKTVFALDGKPNETSSVSWTISADKGSIIFG